MAKIGKTLLVLAKKIIVAFCLIYGFNLIASGLNLFIPINFITIGVVTFLGIPGMLALIAIYFVLH